MQEIVDKHVAISFYCNRKNNVFILLFFVVQKCWVSFSGSVYKEKNKPTKSIGLFFLSNSNCYMALLGIVIFKKF